MLNKEKWPWKPIRSAPTLKAHVLHNTKLSLLLVSYIFLKWKFHRDYNSILGCSLSGAYHGIIDHLCWSQNCPAKYILPGIAQGTAEPGVCWPQTQGQQVCLSQATADEEVHPHSFRVEQFQHFHWICKIITVAAICVFKDKLKKPGYCSRRKFSAVVNLYGEALAKYLMFLSP